MILDLSFDDVATTTRAVRKRLDLTRPVERSVIEECLDIALQAPNGSNRQLWRWVVVDDPELRRAVADVYRAAMDDYVARPRTPAEQAVDRTTPAAQRMSSSVYHLREHFHEVPALVLPLLGERTDDVPLFRQASLWGSILPAVWSFMLALRARGLGSAWTTATLMREQAVADVLGFPADRCTHAGLFPVAYTLGTDFRPARRLPVADVVRWNGWA